MYRKYLVIEDLSYRFTEFEKAVERYRATGNRDIEVDHTADVADVLDDRPIDVTRDRESFPIERLAEYDAFFVDFRLESARLKTAGYFILNSSGEQREPVQVTSGMGVFLYLRQVFESAAFRRARAEVIAERPHRPATPQLLSFTLLAEAPSKFFAVAAQSWFGAQHFEMHSFIDPVVRQLGAMDDLARVERASREVRGAVPAFNEFVDTVIAPGSAQRWNRHKGSTHRAIHECYDWLRLYLAAPGKRGGMQGFKDAASDAFGVQPNWPQSQVANQYAPIAVQMQTAVATYLEAFTTGCEWKDEAPIWAMRDPADPLWDALNDSRDFWEEADVRDALMEHRFRSGMDRSVDFSR